VNRHIPGFTSHAFESTLLPSPPLSNLIRVVFEVGHPSCVGIVFAFPVRPPYLKIGMLSIRAEHKNKKLYTSYLFNEIYE